MEEDHSFSSKDFGSTSHATRLTNLTENEVIKEPPIIKAAKFIADDFKGFGNEIKKHKKSTDEEYEEELHSAMVKAN